VDSERRGYRFDPLDGSGVFLGLGIVQCSLLGSGTVLTVALVSAGLPLALAAGPVACAAGLSFVRSGGHAAWEWMPLLATWIWRGLARSRRWTAPLPLLPLDEERSPPLPPCLRGLDVIEVPWRGPAHIGAVRDHHRRTFTAAVPVQGPPFVVVNREEQERLLAGWGDLLAQFAVDRGLVTHVSWSDLARPSASAMAVASVKDQGVDAGPNASYAELLDKATAVSTEHDVVVCITVAEERLSRNRRAQRTPWERLEQGLLVAIESLLRALRTANIDADDPLGALGLHRLLRLRVDPFLRAPARRTRRARLVDRLGLVTPASSGPLALETAWSHIRLDDGWHRTWWVANWPRLAAPPGWLEPFLSIDAIARTMTVAFAPIPIHRSRRSIERDLVKLASDASTKEEKGRRIDARHTRATEALLEREEELVAGYAEMAYVGLVGVAARSLEELDEHSAIVEQLAREVGMELRLLDGRQDVAWAAALPLGLAPKTLIAG
jgi:hypothetical protein